MALFQSTWNNRMVISNDDNGRVAVRRGAGRNPHSTFLTVLVCGLSAVWALPRPALAEEPFPSHPVTMIIPFSAGGPSDLVGRAVGEGMSRILGQQMIIENVIGAGGTTASLRTSHAAADGYTIMLGHMGTHGAVVAFNSGLRYDPAADFAPIGQISRSDLFIATNKDLPVSDLHDFTAFEAERGTNGNMAHAGFGSISHVTCSLMNSLTNLNPKLIAFQGSYPAMKALTGGKADYICDQATAIVPLAKANAIRVLAVIAPRRNAALPDVPTAAEAGLPSFELSAWNGLFAPRNTPAQIIERLNGAMDKALEDPAVRRRLIELGNEIPLPSERTPQALAGVVREEVARWKKLHARPEEMN